MNPKGQLFVAYVMVVFLVFVALFGLIEIFKLNLDNNRGGSTLNCPGTPDFNQTAYNVQNKYAQLNYRTTCAVTGISFVWFFGAVIIAGVTWIYSQWSKK